MVIKMVGTYNANGERFHGALKLAEMDGRYDGPFTICFMEIWNGDDRIACYVVVHGGESASNYAKKEQDARFPAGDKYSVGLEAIGDYRISKTDFCRPDTKFNTSKVPGYGTIGFSLPVYNTPNRKAIKVHSFDTVVFSNGCFALLDPAEVADLFKRLGGLEAAGAFPMKMSLEYLDGAGPGTEKAKYIKDKVRRRTNAWPGYGFVAGQEVQPGNNTVGELIP